MLMHYLFDQKQSTDIIFRINKLTPDSRPNWGKMNVSQMLAHCQEPLKIALGKATFKRNLFGILFGKLAKKQVVSDKPYKQSLPTAPTFVVKDDRNFETEKTKLLALINEFTQGGEAGLIKDPHPFFGKMTSEEWDKSQLKHLDHHLRQFGV
jgi:hypothetical protein